MFGGAVAQLGARLDGIEEVVGSNPIGSTSLRPSLGEACRAGALSARADLPVKYFCSFRPSPGLRLGNSAG